MKAEITQQRQYLHNPAPSLALKLDIEPAPSAGAVEAAISAVVKHHPLLGCAASMATGGSAYFITTSEPGYTVYSAELESEDDWLDVANDSQRDPFDMEGGELVRFFILEGMGKTQLVICLHRIVGDASCLMSIARGVVSELNRPGSLGDPLNYHAPEPLPKVKIPMMTKTMGKMMNKRWTQTGKAMRREDYVLLVDSYWERPSGIASHVFSAETTARLAERAREKNAGLGSLVASALILAQQDSGEAGYARAMRPDNRLGDMGDYERNATFRFDLANTLPLFDCAGQIAATTASKFADAEERIQTLAFMETLEPTIIDAAYYAAFGGYPDLMAAQARDMFGINGSRAFNLTDLGSADDSSDGRWHAENVRFLPQLSPTAGTSVGMVISGGRLAVAAQFVEEDGSDARDNFLDAMARLEEAE